MLTHALMIAMIFFNTLDNNYLLK